MNASDLILSHLIVFIMGILFCRIGLPLLKKWLMKKWKLEPKKDVKRKEKDKNEQ